ncbi:MAG: TolC family protein [Marinoscillum sp.]|uniref:TolC family protein n=1 Tax=Marinoscillum sp. TaxID=2024838 RepID=UPI0032F90974
MNKIAFLLLILSLSFNASGQIRLSLVDVIDLAKEQSPSAKAAETRKKNLYWQYRSFKSDYNPSLNLTGNLPGYNRDFFQVSQDDGTFAYRSREQLSSSLNLGLIQPISVTGGEISINSNLNQFNDLNASSSTINPIYNTTLFNIQLVQPVFGFNQLKWDKRTEPLRYEESKRSYVEEMEFISLQSTNLYFDYMDAQINLQIAQFNLANNDTIFNIEQGRYNIGTTSKDKLLQVELQLLRSKQDVAQANLDLQTSRLALRRYIGVQDSTASKLELLIPEELPEFSIELDKALTYAKQNRADYIEFERRRAEADRDVASARAQRFQTNLVASFGLNNAAGDLPQTYNNPNDQQRVNLTLSVPILDWGRSKSRVQTALANQELTQYTLDQEIQNFEQEIITLVSRMDVIRLQVEITKKSDEVAQERYEVAQNRYLIGKIDITNLNIALTEKDNARRSYIGALRSFWAAYFDLRRLTLYDFLNDELLYQELD